MFDVILNTPLTVIPTKSYFPIFFLNLCSKTDIIIVQFYQILGDTRKVYRTYGVQPNTQFLVGLNNLYQNILDVWKKIRKKKKAFAFQARYNRF